MPPARTLPALGALALALAGCGGDDGPAPEDEVRGAMAGFARATAERDVQALCDRVLSRGLVARVEQAGLPCEQAMRIGLQEVRRPTLEVLDVRVEGDRARARVRTGAQGQAASEDTVQLVREDGRWRVASLAG
jgi:ketosteroid isomerase-like protein